ncbi:restriction endonuclease subunit S [Streptomyces sp. B93]|uniref:restriction endonuclease subunit S n=1 Tax=Streptomyces sp. B93 TaxID=2824875 RepID=UPI001B37BE54|nr:restriction endonuclease subunit S [Streptomyces sp. B93]MBQ1092303.1 restriction endonuclease subunit S [Streptomyces sp. B93]
MSEGGIPSEVPKGWARVRLGDILARIEAGKSYKCEPRPASAEEWGVIKVSAMTWGDFDEGENKAVPVGFPFNPDYEIRPGDILLSRANTAAYVGASVLVRQCRPRLLLSDKSLRLVPADGVDREWLAYLLSSPVIRSQISERATGTKDSMRNISQGALEELECLLPPVEEQRRIVAALEEQLSRLNAAVEAVEQSSMRSRQLWSAILHQMTEGTLSRDVRRPVAWARTDEVAVVQGGIQKQAKRRPVENKFPFLRVANVPRGRLALDDVHEIELFDGELERYRLKVGDLLVVEGNGSPDQIGRAASWRGEIEDCVHQNHLIRVRPGGRLRAEFLELAWNSPKVAQQLKKVASSTSGLHTLSTAKVKSVEIPVPSLEEQDALLEAVQQWRTNQLAAEAAQQAALIRAAGLRRSLLAEAFAGRLILQDSADEPAEVLLTRIREEREAAGATKPRRRSPRRAPAQRKRTPDTAPAPPPRADASALASATQPTLDLEIPS